MAEQPRAKPPKTPLKRVSRNSLRSHTLSASHPPPSDPDHHRPTHQTQTQHPSNHLDHLAPLFVDLNDAITDLHVNLSNLDLVCKDLDGFNESFSAFIYGLRMNAYVTDFDEAPKLQSFQALHARKDSQRHHHQLLLQHTQQLDPQNQTLKPEDSSHNDSDDSCTASIPQASTSNSTTNVGQTDPTNARSTSKIRTEPKAKNYTQASKLQQKQLLKFTSQVLTSLPLKFREQQPYRHEMELVISLLKLHPNGLLIKDIVKLEPSLPMHRARDCATSLVAAKKAVKFNKDGISYKLVLN